MYVYVCECVCGCTCRCISITEPYIIHQPCLDHTSWKSPLMFCDSRLQMLCHILPKLATDVEFETLTNQIRNPVFGSSLLNLIALY